jgi:thiol-disulfide isomerase/thioredoxin
VNDREVTVTSTAILVFLLTAIVAIALGRALLPRSRALAGLLLVGGFGAVATLALAQLSGRLGPQQLWFRAPTFYLALAVLIAGAIWWLRRPATRFTRLGLPACALVLIAGVLVLARFDGRSAPLAMMLPTLQNPAPDLSFFDTTGRRRELAEFRGKVVLINFWATWCGPCRLEMPMLSKLQAEHADAGLVVLYISLEEPRVLADFLRDHHFDGVQGRLANAAPYYDAGKFYPLSYLVNRDGRVVQRWSGRPRESWLAEQVRAQTTLKLSRVAAPAMARRS